MKDLSRLLYRMFEATTDALLLFRPREDGEWELVRANAAAASMHDLDIEAMPGRTLAEIFSNQLDPDFYWGFLDEIVRNGSVSMDSFRWRPDRSVIRVEFGAKFMDMDGKSYIHLRERDISERFAMEAKSRESEKLFRTMIETCPDSMMLLRPYPDRPWPIVQCNARTAEMHGYRIGELLGMTLADLNTGPWLLEETVAWLARLRSEGSIEGEATHKRKNGEVFTIEYHTVLFSFGGIEYNLAIDRDITDRKRIDEELLQGRKLRAVGEMSGGIAHEFNNLLTPMLLQLGTMKEAYRDNSLMLEHLKPFDTAISNARDLTQRILSFGHREQVAVEPLDLAAVMGDTVTFMAKMMDSRITVSFDGRGPSYWVRQNRVDIEQIIMNLAINARDAVMQRIGTDASPSWGPEIALRCETEERTRQADAGVAREGKRLWCVISVSDNGCGMDEETRQRIFEPFFTTKESGRGTGLGLSTVWSLATRMTGWVEVESKVNVGTTFRVFLPAMSGPIPSVSRELPVESEVSAKTGSDGARARVLIVDDNDLISELLAKIVTRRGHESTVVADGRAAIGKLMDPGKGYDLIITDINMPGLLGIDVLKQIRKEGLSCKSIVIGGYITPEIRETLGMLAVDAILDKPFAYDQIVSILGKWGW